MEVNVNTITCKRCGWKWVPRKADVRSCPNPKCRSVYFDREKTEETKKSEENKKQKPKMARNKLKGFGG